MTKLTKDISSLDHVTSINNFLSDVDFLTEDEIKHHMKMSIKFNEKLLQFDKTDKYASRKASISQDIIYLLKQIK